MEIVNENTPPLIKRHGGRQPKYPWDEWLRHNHAVRLVEGSDFDCTAASLRMMSYNQARRRGGRVRVSIGEDILGRNTVELTFQFTTATIKKQQRELDDVEQVDNDLVDDSEIVTGQWGPPKTLPNIDGDLFPRGIREN